MAEPSPMSKTRSAGNIYDADTDFPPSKDFQPPTKLPTLQSVISMIRYNLEMGNGRVTTNVAAREVAKQVYAKYFHDTVFCVSLSTILRRVEGIWKQFTEGRKRYGQTGKENSLAVKQYKELFHTKSELFDVFAHNPIRRQSLVKEWGVSMSEMEHKYYEDQKTERRMFCSKGVDPVWYHSMMRTQRLRERSKEYQRKRDQQFQYQTLDHITDMLIEAGEISSCSSDEEQEGRPQKRLRQMSETDTHKQLQKEGEESEVRAEPKGRKKLFMDVAEPDMDEDPLPQEFQHIRLSERKV